jgi:hypothetical protein
MVSAPRRARNSGQGRAQRPPTLDRRVSQKAAESRKRRLLRSSASVLVQMSAATKWRVSRRCVAAFPASDVSRAERVRLSVDSGRSQPRRSPGVPATPSATPCRDGLRVRRGLARHRATERAISARVRVAGGKSGSAESGRPEPSRALRARRGRVQGPNRRRRRGGENLDRRRTPARGRAHGPDPRGASVSARRAASRPHLLYFPLAGAFPRLRCERAILAKNQVASFRGVSNARREEKYLPAGAKTSPTEPPSNVVVVGNRVWFFGHGASRDVSFAVCSRERTESASSFQTLTRYVARREHTRLFRVCSYVSFRRKPRTGKS